MLAVGAVALATGVAVDLTSGAVVAVAAAAADAAAPVDLADEAALVAAGLDGVAATVFGTWPSSEAAG